MSSEPGQIDPMKEVECDCDPMYAHRCMKCGGRGFVPRKAGEPVRPATLGSNSDRLHEDSMLTDRPVAPAVPDAADRCGNCDHHAELHDINGCSIRVQVDANKMVVQCPCNWNASQASSKREPVPTARHHAEDCEFQPKGAETEQIYCTCAVPDAAARLAPRIIQFLREIDWSASSDQWKYDRVAALIREAGEMRPAPFPDCNVGTPHECCVARMKRLERERSGASPAVPPKLTRWDYDVVEQFMRTTPNGEWVRYVDAEAYAQHVAAGETRDEEKAILKIKIEVAHKALLQEIKQRDELRAELAKAESEAVKLREALKHLIELGGTFPKTCQICADVERLLAGEKVKP